MGTRLTAAGDVGFRGRASSDVRRQTAWIGWFGGRARLPMIVTMSNDPNGKDGGRELGRGGHLADPRVRETAERERHKQQLSEFLADATRDVERMRAMEPELEASDAASWDRVQILAHNLAARSLALKLGVLNACARELEQLTEDRAKGTPLDTFFKQCVVGAIETLALEIDQLKRA